MNWIDEAVLLLAKSLDPIPSELNEIDWKEKLSANSERVAEHLSAFSNYDGGGYLAYGINNNGLSTPLNAEDTELVITKLGNIARNNIYPPLSLEHSVINFKGSPVLFIRIPQSTERPVHTKNNPFDCFRRSAGQTVKMTKREIQTMLISASGLDFEEQIVIDKISSDDALKLLSYDSYFDLTDTRLPDTKIAILEKLSQDEIVKKNGDKWDITNLGAMLFAKDLLDFRALKRKAIRVIVYKESSRVNAIKEISGRRGYATGFQGLINYIMNELPSNEVIENALRKKAKVYPEKAIREFVANALIHQDLNISGRTVMIEIFSDRIEITNPGVPLVDTNRFIDTPPKSRNEQMADLMMRSKICERRGSGVDRAIEAIELHQLPAPKFDKGDDYTKVTMYAPILLRNMNSEDRIRACYQHTCLRYVNNLPVNNKSVRERFKIGVNNTSYASKIISDSIEAGLIKPSRPDNISKKYASYIPYWAS